MKAEASSCVEPSAVPLVTWAKPADVPSGRAVAGASEDGSRGVELRRAQGRAIGDVGGIGPGDCRRRGCGSGSGSGSRAEVKPTGVVGVGGDAHVAIRRDDVVRAVVAEHVAGAIAGVVRVMV